MGTVWLPTFYPRWRVRFVLLETAPPLLYGGIWHRTQEDAEKHATFILDGDDGMRVIDVFDFEHEERAGDVEYTSGARYWRART